MLRLLHVLAQEVIVVFVLDHRSEIPERCRHVADHRQFQRRPATDVAGVPVDLNDFHLLVRQEVGEREVRPEHQENVGLIDGAVAAAVTEQSGHADGVGVVMLEPRLALEAVADRRLEPRGQRAHLVLGQLAAVPAEDGHGLRLVDRVGHGRQVRGAGPPMVGPAGALERDRRCVGRCHVAWHRDHHRPALGDRRGDGGTHHGPQLPG